MNIGFMGAGNISGLVVPAVQSVSAIRRVAVAARKLSDAQRFAEKWGFERAYAGYDALLEDPDVEVVYIGTPHALHCEQIMRCLEHGKGVICEKAFCLNAEQAKRVIDYSQEKGLFLAEAIWTRYMPSRHTIANLLESGAIGTPRMLTANLCYPIDDKARLIRPELGGGALLDVGVYPLNFALMCFGDQIKEIHSAVQLHETGVDGMESITLRYADGKMAVLTAGMYSRSDRQGIIHGDKGYLIVENINNPQSVRVYNNDDQLQQEILFAQRVNGYEYEFEEMAAAFDSGLTQTQSMPLAQTLAVMELCDALRAQWGVQYPVEMK